MGVSPVNKNRIFFLFLYYGDIIVSSYRSISADSSISSIGSGSSDSLTLVGGSKVL